MTHFVCRMSGRRTGFHFAWTCSVVLAADIRASSGSFFRCPQKRGRVFAPSKRGSGAPYGAGRGPALCEGQATSLAIGRPRLTALHCGVIRWWDPSAPPERHGSLGPDITRRRDGRLHPGLHCEPGGLLHTSPGSRLAKPARGAPSPSTLSVARPSAPLWMGMIRIYSIGKSLSMNIFIIKKSLKSNKAIFDQGHTA